MNYDLALCAIGGKDIGYGHIMRAFALAEAAVAMGKKVVAVIGPELPPISWPCPVMTITDKSVDFAQNAETVIFDYPRVPRPRTAHGVNPWCFIDAPLKPEILERDWSCISGLIYPHFGAQPVPGIPTLAGEQWMPIRPIFGDIQAGPRCGIALMHPGIHPDNADELVAAGCTAVHMLTGGDAEWSDSVHEMAQVDCVVTPPCTLAYEALAAGQEVYLMCPEDDPRRPIGEAMVEQGVAEWWSADLGKHAGRRTGNAPRLDPHGAERILEALL